MSVVTLIGIALIVLGLIGLIYGGITYTSREDKLDAGPLRITVEEQRRLPLSPIFGGVSLLAGIVLLVTERKRIPRK
jgi:hypothetical protein